MKQFLTPRTLEDEANPVHGLPTEDEEDADMDVDESQDNPPVGDVPAERVVDAREMDALIELFRHHAVKGVCVIELGLRINGSAYLVCVLSGTVVHSPRTAVKRPRSRGAPR
jgi:hypothetical protein